MAVELCYVNKNRIFNCDDNQIKEQSFIIDSVCSFSNDAIAVLDDKKHIVFSSKKFQSWFSFENIEGESFIKLMNKIVQLPDDFFNEKSYFLKIKDKELDRVLQAQISKYFDI